MTAIATHQTYIYIGLAGAGDAIGPGMFGEWFSAKRDSIALLQ